MVKVLEAVPNLSEGRDPETLAALRQSVARPGVEVLDDSADPDHNRSVVTFIGDPDAVEAAAMDLARCAVERIDLGHHRGVHPRVGALDVLPFVPLHGLDMIDAVASAHRVGAALAEMGVPVYFYGAASDPPGRRLAGLRRGGFEALRAGFPAGREPDLPAGVTAPHPTAGVTCVGARPVLLAWNVFVTGIGLRDAKEIAAAIRETAGGFQGLRALGLRLPEQGRTQISMNLEDAERASPMAVFEAIESEVARLGGRIDETEVIGMIPDTLVHPAAGGRLLLSDFRPARVLSQRVAEFLSKHAGGPTEISDSAE